MFKKEKINENTLLIQVASNKRASRKNRQDTRYVALSI